MFKNGTGTRRRAKLGLVSLKNKTVRENCLSEAKKDTKLSSADPLSQTIKKRGRTSRGATLPPFLRTSQNPTPLNDIETGGGFPNQSQFNASAYLEYNADLKYLGMSQSVAENHSVIFGNEERRNNTRLVASEETKQNAERVALMDNLCTEKCLGLLDLHCIVVVDDIDTTWTSGVLDALHRSVRFLTIYITLNESKKENKSSDKDRCRDDFKDVLDGLFQPSVFRNNVLVTCCIEKIEMLRKQNLLCKTVVLSRLQSNVSDSGIGTFDTGFQCCLTLHRFLLSRKLSATLGKTMFFRLIEPRRSLVSFLNRSDVPSASVEKIQVFDYQPGDKQIKPIALYFPQFHPIPENNKFWSEGFTEWTLLKPCTALKGAAKLRKPHADIGYYDGLGMEHRTKQGEMCKKYGLYGLCFYHYWFGDRKVMHRPAEQMLIDGQPDTPFFFSWANETWTKRWDGSNHQVLLQQDYGDEKMWIAHFQYLLPFFKHSRYVKIDNKPVFCFYRLPDISFDIASSMLQLWKRLAKNNGFDGIYVVATLNQWLFPQQYECLLDACFEFYPGFISTTLRAQSVSPGLSSRVMTRSGSAERPKCFHTLKMHALADRRPPLRIKNVEQYSGTYVSFNNTPRHRNSTDKITFHDEPYPRVFYCGLLRAMSRALYTCPRNANDIFVFINAFNEWNEGAVLEPSEQDGYGMLEAVREALAFFGQHVQQKPLHSRNRAMLCSRKAATTNTLSPLLDCKNQSENVNTWYSRHWKKHFGVAKVFTEQRNLFFEYCSSSILYAASELFTKKHTSQLSMLTHQKIAVCCQMHQTENSSISEDVFRWIESLYLAATSVGGSIDVFFTVLHESDRQTLCEQLSSNARVWAARVCRIDVWSSNRGMDVGAFLWQLHEMKTVNSGEQVRKSTTIKHDNRWKKLSRYDLVIKLHSKSESNWRKTLGDPLFGSFETCVALLNLMATQTSIGMCGSAALCLGECEGQNSTRLRALEKTCFGRLTTVAERQFVGGTIFAQRASILEDMIERLGLSYIKEAFQSDAVGHINDTKPGGTYAHTFERFFGYYTRMRSFHIAPIPM